MDPIWKNTNSVCEINQIQIVWLENSVPKPELGYDSRINSLRNCIDSIDSEIWKKVRWYINNYDFIVEGPIINRAFYKFWEIIQSFHLLEPNFEKIVCLAEAPGGFIQGTNYYYNSLNQKKDKDNNLEKDGFIQVKNKKKKKNVPMIYSMSLNKSHPLYKNYNLPSYNENVIKSNVKIFYGNDGTGDITKEANLNLFKSILRGSPEQSRLPEQSRVDFISADGGFDEGNDFNNKEQLHYILFLTEIIYGITLLKENGNFLIKFFDTFTDTSLDLLWLLSSCFREMYIYKPYTSRPTNSEKYIICKGLLKISESFKDNLNKIFQEINQKNKKESSKYISFRLFEEHQIPERFRKMIFLINQTILNGQCHFLQEAITLCYDTNFSTNFDQLKDSATIARKESFNKWALLFKKS
jgi:23S rRNA U2552 (ribose-2'-O)-methylase RlmE/FtsJ